MRLPNVSGHVHQGSSSSRASLWSGSVSQFVSRFSQPRSTLSVYRPMVLGLSRVTPVAEQARTAPSTPRPSGYSDADWLLYLNTLRVVALQHRQRDEAAGPAAIPTTRSARANALCWPKTLRTFERARARPRSTDEMDTLTPRQLPPVEPPGGSLCKDS
eukprot:6686145-Prymnesium_polylepis.2